MTPGAMQSTRGKTWRSPLFEGSTGRPGPRDVAAPASPGPPADEPHGSQRVWAFLCPNPTCDTELVVFPEFAGSTVECPTCGFTFICPRVVPLQVVPESGAAGSPPAPRPFAPGARLAQRSGDAGVMRSLRPPAPPPHPPAGPPRSEKPKATPADVAAAMPEAAAKRGEAADALSALAQTVGGAAPRPLTGERAGHDGQEYPAASAAGSSSTAPHAEHAASTAALRALANATTTPEGRKAAKRRAPKGGGLGAQLASAAFEGDRRRAERVCVASDGANAREAMDQAARRWSALDGPLSEGERTAARRQRMDLAVTWIVAAVISASLALVAFVTGVPDIGLGSLLFLGLAGARTWWLMREKGENRDAPGR